MTDGRAIKFFANTFGIVEKGYLDVHFVKRGKEELTPQQIVHQLLVSTMRNSPVDTLYHYMKVVYEPLMVSEPQYADTLNSQLKNLIGSLKAGLATTLRQGDERKYDPSYLEGILSPSDEIDFW